MRSLQFLFAALLTVWLGPAAAELTIRITQGVEGALPIAVVPFAWVGGAGSPPPAEDIAEIIRADLAGSGRFKSIAVADMPQRPVDSGDVRYPLWQSVGADNLVLGRIGVAGDGRYEVSVQLLDAFQGSQLDLYVYKVSADGLRRLSHFLSDQIYQRLTGERGAFATRIAYVTVTRTTGGKSYALMVADADGHGPQSVLKSREPLMSPNWSPDGQKLAYVSFEIGKPQIYIQEVYTGKRTLATGFDGINSAPSWSPDGRSLALVLSRDGNAEIYTYTVADKSLFRVTRNTAIDTEPVWTGDGKRLIFTSDRGGSPQLYEISAGGGSASRLTFEGRYNARANLSPNDRRIAMVHLQDSNYRIAVLDRDTGLLQVLSRGRLDESPSFAPNGSTILYASSESNRGVLETVSVDGRVRQRLLLQQGDVREPAWSPYAR